MILDKRLDRPLLGFLIAGECNDQISFRPEALAHQSQKRSCQYRCAYLVIEHTATVIKPAIFAQCEWIPAPVAFGSTDNIHVGDEEDRAFF